MEFPGANARVGGRECHFPRGMPKRCAPLTSGIRCMATLRTAMPAEVAGFRL